MRALEALGIHSPFERKNTCAAALRSGPRSASLFLLLFCAEQGVRRKKKPQVDPRGARKLNMHGGCHTRGGGGRGGGSKQQGCRTRQDVGYGTESARSGGYSLWPPGVGERPSTHWQVPIAVARSQAAWPRGLLLKAHDGAGGAVAVGLQRPWPSAVGPQSRGLRKREA